MHIRKLELQGFKSFVDRQSFHFGSGIAGVVGPNGCGKSNVVDAIKWCIGEQSAKSLRGGAMQDIIFAGSANRSPVGMAEVTLTFGCGEEPFPGQWSRFEELQVTRRLYRDGTSEYLINQTRVRLRDVNDLFMDTGVGNKLYSFIEQGRVDQIIHAKPENRRSIIEEAAGISRYKARRVEALGKLENTQANLARATDVSEEMGRRLRSLERQVAKAARYRRLRVHVRQGELFLGLVKYADLSAERRLLATRLRDTLGEEESTTRELERRERELQGTRDEIAVMEQVVGGLRDEVAELEAQRRETESARHYQTREAADLGRRVDVLAGELEEAGGQRQEAAREAASLEAELTEARSVLESEEGHLAARQQAAQQAEASLAATRREVEQHKDRVVDAVKEISRAKAGLEANAGRNADLDRRLGEQESEGQQTDDELGRLELSLEASRTAAEASETRLRAATDALEAARGALRDAQGQVGQLGRDHRQAEAALTAAEREQVRTEAHLRSLQELQESHAGVEGGARQVLAKGRTLGTVAEHLDVPELLEERLGAAALGGLDHVVVEDEAALLEAAAIAQKAGRTGFVLLQDARQGSGLTEQLHGSEAGLAALGALIGHCEQAPDLKAALALSRKTGARVVTPSGDLVLPGGVVYAGPVRVGASKTILKRRREIAGLERRLQEHRDAVVACTEAVTETAGVLERARGGIAGADTAVEAAKAELTQCQQRWSEARHQLREIAADVDRRKGQAQRVANEAARIRAELERLAQANSELSGRVATAELRLADDERALNGLRVVLGEREQAANAARESLTRARTERGGRRERVQLLEASHAGACRRRDGADARIQRATVESTTARDRIAELEEDDRRLSEKLQELGEAQGERRDKLQSENTRLQRQRESLAEAEAGLKSLRDRREGATAARTRLELKIQEVRLQVEKVREQAEERYQASLPGMLDTLERDAALVIEVGDPGRSELPVDESGLPEVEDLRITAAMMEEVDRIEFWVQRVADARKRIERLGEVNLAALEEYEEVRERHDWLVEQREDLEASMAEILRAIAKINRTCRERFRDAYDRINGHFQRLYPKLVPGGKASLSLTNEDDLLETGVDIFVQPPGKRLQNLSLLSGGEKAMTAIALIFSLFQVKPSPFCLLDEVDAPLDESNGARFNDMLREMSSLSQFIVITHNKKTMEVVDTLYGVTMPDPGISRLVSVQVS